MSLRARTYTRPAAARHVGHHFAHRTGRVAAFPTALQPSLRLLIPPLQSFKALVFRICSHLVSGPPFLLLRACAMSLLCRLLAEAICLARLWLKHLTFHLFFIFLSVFLPAYSCWWLTSICLLIFFPQPGFQPFYSLVKGSLLPLYTRYVAPVGWNESDRCRSGN